MFHKMFEGARRSISESSPTNVCKHYRKDTGTCRIGCPEARINKGDDCPYYPLSNKGMYPGNFEDECPCFSGVSESKINEEETKKPETPVASPAVPANVSPAQATNPVPAKAAPAAQTPPATQAEQKPEAKETYLFSAGEAMFYVKDSGAELVVIKKTAGNEAGEEVAKDTKENARKLILKVAQDNAAKDIGYDAIKDYVFKMEDKKEPTKAEAPATQPAAKESKLEEAKWLITVQAGDRAPYRTKITADSKKQALDAVSVTAEKLEESKIAEATYKGKQYKIVMHPKSEGEQSDVYTVEIDGKEIESIPGSYSHEDAEAEAKDYIDELLAKKESKVLEYVKKMEVGAEEWIPTGNAQLVYSVEGEVGEKFRVTRDGTMVPKGEYEIVDKDTDAKHSGPWGAFSYLKVKKIAESMKESLSKEQWQLVVDAVNDAASKFKLITKVDPVDIIDLEGQFHLNKIEKTRPAIQKYIEDNYKELAKDTKAMDEFWYKFDEVLMDLYADAAYKKYGAKESVNEYQDDKYGNNESKLQEALTDKGIETVKKWIEQFGHRKAAIKMVDSALLRKIGLTSSDMPDTVVFANGVDGIEDQLKDGDFQGAWESAKETMRDMLEDEGFEEAMEAKKKLSVKESGDEDTPEDYLLNALVNLSLDFELRKYGGNADNEEAVAKAYKIYDEVMKDMEEHGAFDDMVVRFYDKAVELAKKWNDLRKEVYGEYGYSPETLEKLAKKEMPEAKQNEELDHDTRERDAKREEAIDKELDKLRAQLPKVTPRERKRIKNQIDELLKELKGDAKEAKVEEADIAGHMREQGEAFDDHMFELISDNFSDKSFTAADAFKAYVASYFFDKELGFDEEAMADWLNDSVAAKIMKKSSDGKYVVVESRMQEAVNLTLKTLYGGNKSISQKKEIKLHENLTDLFKRD